MLLPAVAACCCVRRIQTTSQSMLRACCMAVSHLEQLKRGQANAQRWSAQFQDAAALCQEMTLRAAPPAMTALRRAAMPANLRRRQQPELSASLLLEQPGDSSFARGLTRLHMPLAFYVHMSLFVADVQGLIRTAGLANFLLPTDELTRLRESALHSLCALSL